MTQQQQSFDVGSEPGTPTADMLAEITVYLAKRDLYGLVWCDETLTTTHIFGKLAEFIPLGSDIIHSLLPLMGFEEQITALRRHPDNTVQLPNISIRHAAGTSPRMNINVYWIPKRKLYVIVLTKVLRRSDLELELTNQIRAKRIAERNLAEKSKELQRANRELSLANGDLEEFAYVISHDLKAPLRALKYLSGDLQLSVTSMDAQAANAQVQQLQNQTKRMSSMLMGLFEYASLGRKQDAIERVNTATLISQIVSSLDSIPGMKISIDGHWPVLNTLEQPLDLVLRNLIENALKHHDRHTGRIDISAQDVGEFWCIEIKDDGPGIPVDYKEAVFRTFQKVHNDDNVENSGVGLALVKKSVETIGGTVELLSDPSRSRGSTFRIMWPQSVST